jgi:hypothetical protein
MLWLLAAAIPAAGESIRITTEGPNAPMQWEVVWSDSITVVRTLPFQIGGTDISITPDSFRPQFNQSLFVPAAPAYSPGFQVFLTIPGQQELILGPDRIGYELDFSNYQRWNGVWYANFAFTLPENAVNISLRIDSLWADDRAVVYLNGRAIADRIVDTGSAIAGPGNINQGLNTDDYAYRVFVNASQYVVNDQSVFNTGGINTLKAIINNTGMGGVDERAYSFRSNGDRTSLRLNAEVTFDLATPEPAFGGVVALALGAILWRARRKRQSAN